MFCDPSFCPTAYTGLLIIGLVLGLFLAWFILRTRLAGRLLGAQTALWRLRALRPLSRRGRILWVILAEGMVIFFCDAPALNYLLPLPPVLAQAPNLFGIAGFLVAWLAGFLLAVEVDRNLEHDEKPPGPL